MIPSQQRKSEEIHVGLSWTEGLGKYKLTKVITLAPRFLLKNNLSEAICFREHGVAPRDRSIISASQRCPLHFMRTGQEKLLTMAFPGLNAHWCVEINSNLSSGIKEFPRSPPINIQDIGSVHFRLRVPGDQETVRLLRADVKIDGSTIFVYFSHANEGWPFIIENDSDYKVALCQTVSKLPSYATRF